MNSVSPIGLQFLNSCTPDCQPPLRLSMSYEMINADGDEDPTGQGRDSSNLGPAGSEGLSQVWFLVVDYEGNFFRIDFSFPGSAT